MIPKGMNEQEQAIYEFIKNKGSVRKSEIIEEFVLKHLRTLRSHGYLSLTEHYIWRVSDDS